MESRVHQVIGVGFLLLMVVMGLLRVGAQDVLPWLVVYGALMLLIGVNILRPLPLVFSVLPMVVLVLAAIFIWPDQYQDGAANMNSKLEAKLIQDSVGLLVCAAACGYVAVRSYVRTKRKKLAISSLG
jgi:hypothetical protein